MIVRRINTCGSLIDVRDSYMTKDGSCTLFVLNQTRATLRVRRGVYLKK